jgi:hypothetical protein
MAIPKEGYFNLEKGRYGAIFPKTPACYGFSVVAKVKPGREQAVRDYGRSIEEAVKANPNVLAPLKLHYAVALFDCIKSSISEKVALSFSAFLISSALTKGYSPYSKKLGH